LAVIDPFAKFGKEWPIYSFKSGVWKKKSIGGFIYGLLAGIVKVCLATFLVFHVDESLTSGVHWMTVFTVYLFGALASSVAEILSPKWDNVTIPTTALIVMGSLFLLL